MLSNKTVERSLSKVAGARSLAGHRSADEIWWVIACASLFFFFFSLFFLHLFNCLYFDPGIFLDPVGRLEWVSVWWVLSSWPGSTLHRCMNNIYSSPAIFLHICTLLIFSTCWCGCAHHSQAVIPSLNLV